MGAKKKRRAAEQASATSSAADPSTMLVSVKELSRHLSVSRGTIHRLVRIGQIPYTQVGRQKRFDLVAVRSVLDRAR